MGKIKKREIIECIGGIVLLISVSFGAYLWLDTHFAHAGDLTQVREMMQKLSLRLDYKIIEDRLEGIKREIWTIEDRYCLDKSKPCTEEKMPQTVRDRYRELKCEKVKLEDELARMKK